MYIMIICHWAICFTTCHSKPFAGRSDDVFWWIPALFEDQEIFCQIHQNYLVALTFHPINQSSLPWSWVPSDILYSRAVWPCSSWRTFPRRWPGRWSISTPMRSSSSSWKHTRTMRVSWQPMAVFTWARITFQKTFRIAIQNVIGIVIWTTCVHMHCKRLPNHDQDLRTAR